MNLNRIQYNVRPSSLFLMPGGMGSPHMLKSFPWNLFVNNNEKPKSYEKPQKLVTNVFISYNHKDAEVMRETKSFLEKNEIDVTVDIKDLQAGIKINDFIDLAIKNNKYIISIISENSLLSGWVNKEFTISTLLNRLGDKRWIPLKIDNSCFDANFFFLANEKIDNQLNEIRKNMRHAIDIGHDVAAFSEEFKRLNALKSNLPKTISILKEVFVTDISGNNFNLGMNHMLKIIK